MAEGETRTPLVSVVMPCLNEQEALAICIEKIKKVFEQYNIDGEIVVSDNGSTDRSVSIAENMGVRVVHEPTRGYGNACITGFAAASGKYMIMVDADNTYDFNLIPQFIEKLDQEHYDYVTGSRYLNGGNINVPFLHRFVGHPVLTSLLNTFFASKYSDVCCGFRGFTRKGYELIKPTCAGMELALDLAINAQLAKLKIAEIPITLGPRIGQSKINTFKDGWQHLKLILLRAFEAQRLNFRQQIEKMLEAINGIGPGNNSWWHNGFWPPALIIFAAMLLAGYWVFLVPIFQSPDEDTHADYVFSLYSRGRLIRAKEAPLVATSHPFVIHLLKATNGKPISCTTFAKVPPGYGTKEFFQDIDRSAPAKDTLVATNPAHVYVYPVGYYALTAMWLSLLSHLDSHLSFLFFAARFLSVILLGIGLALSYLIMRESGLSEGNSSLVLAVIAFFPLTPFVGSYIQPDILSLVAVNACLLLALQWKKKVKETIPCALGLALAILLLTKYQFFNCVGVAVVAMVIAQVVHLKYSPPKAAAILAALVIPSAIAALLQTWISCYGHLPDIDNTHWHWFPTFTEFSKVLGVGGSQLFTHIGNALCDQYNSTYSASGTTFRSFWGAFGQSISVPLIIGSVAINDALRSIIEWITKIILFLTLASLLKVIAGLLRLVHKGRLSAAFYIMCSNPVINSYFLFVLFMYVFNVVSFPSFWGQGRHWFPLMLPLILAATLFASRVFPSRILRKQFFYTLTIAWLCYSVVGDYYAIACVHKRFYESDRQPGINLEQLKRVPAKTACWIQDFEYLDYYNTFNRHVYPLSMHLGDEIIAKGWAIDQLNASPALAVLLCIDKNKIYQATYGLESPEAIEQLHDQKYRFTGFGTLISTRDIGPGAHHLSVKVVSKNGFLLYTDANLDFTIK